MAYDDGWFLSKNKNILHAKNEKRSYEISGDLTIPFLNEDAEELYLLQNGHAYNEIK